LIIVGNNLCNVHQSLSFDKIGLSYIVDLIVDLNVFVKLLSLFRLDGVLMVVFPPVLGVLRYVNIVTWGDLAYFTVFVVLVISDSLLYA
jgi:hypothetical protein